MTDLVWIPESTTAPGLYALKAPKSMGHIDAHGTAYGTYLVSDAMRFLTEGECWIWCDKWNAQAGGHGFCANFAPVELDLA